MMPAPNGGQDQRRFLLVVKVLFKGHPDAG